MKTKLIGGNLCEEKRGYKRNNSNSNEDKEEDKTGENEGLRWNGE